MDAARIRARCEAGQAAKKDHETERARKPYLGLEATTLVTRPPSGLALPPQRREHSPSGRGVCPIFSDARPRAIDQATGFRKRRRTCPRKASRNIPPK